MGVKCPPYYGKSKFYQHKKENASKKIAKYENKINEQKEIIIVCEKEIAKYENK